MCKVFAITNMEKVKVTKKLLTTVRNEVCKSGDKDGFGYAVLNDDHSLGGERTMRPLNFQPLAGDPMDSVTGRLPIVSKTRNVFGKSEFANPKSFIGHGRFSTNDISLDNTHPFYDGDIALIHNGVVRDPDQAIKDLTTTCDTEIILKAWAQGGLKKVSETVVGYYALAVLDSNSGLLHIVRDDKANLFVAFSPTIDSFIIATTPEIIKGVAKKMKWKVEASEEVLENIHVVFDRNAILSNESFKPRSDSGRSYMSETERKALYGSSYSGYGGYSPSSLGSSLGHSEANIFDATKTSYSGESLVDDDEPSYREMSQQSLEAEITSGEQDRMLIDDGGANVDDTRYDQGDYSVDGIDGYEDAYGLNRKIS